MTADLRRYALDALRNGRVTVTERKGERIEAQVESSRGPSWGNYVVDRWETGQWSCTCRAFMRNETRHCGHVAAVAMVTGHPTGARRT